MEQQEPHPYQRIEQAIAYLHRQFPRQVPLEELAAQVHLSPFHFQRLFTAWAGVSPKKYLQFLTHRYARQQLALATSLAEVSETAGLSGPGRLHDLFVTLEGATPGEVKAQGAGLEICYGLHQTPFGLALLAVTSRGLCKLAFTEEPERHLQELRAEWPQAQLLEDSAATAPYAKAIFELAAGGPDLRLLLRGTPFQLKVWQALLQIPEGALVTYSHIAEAIGLPKAVRAVGTAIGQNPVAYLIPCHRVIRKEGGWGDYRWGMPRKLALIAWEASRVQGEAVPETAQLALWESAAAADDGR